jgi:hypothetical protein
VVYSWLFYLWMMLVSWPDIVHGQGGRLFQGKGSDFAVTSHAQHAEILAEQWSCSFGKVPLIGHEFDFIALIRYKPIPVSFS